MAWFMFARTVLVAAVVSAAVLLQPLPFGLPLNVAFGTRTDLLTLVVRLEDLLGHPLAVEHRDARVGDVRDSHADGTRFTARFPEIVPVPLRAALATTLAWFEERAGRV